ncbi:MAG: DUF2235 domain-containing protein [Granulicella sp.]
MGKRIVYCADGTWQGPLNGTNVYKMYKGLTVSSEQITFYDDGVGAGSTGLKRIIGGATGAGLLQKVVDGYTQIAHVYEDGDEIFLFGFSRGAYTARSIAGFIATCGLPTGSFTDDCVTQAYAAYRDKPNRAAILATLGACGLGQAIVRMIGVWDTVGALGVPALAGGIDAKQYGFLDTNLSPSVKNAFQCLSIDEQRLQFPATLWTSAPTPGQTIDQVWFSGCHADIGGGTLPGAGVDGDTRLCDITLGWMVAKALTLGLTMDPAFVAQYQALPLACALDKYSDSWAGLPLGPPHRRPIPADARIANSVAVRVQYALTYTPTNLTLEEGLLGDGYTVVPVMSEDAF